MNKKFEFPKIENSEDYQMFQLTLKVINENDRDLVEKMVRAMYYDGVGSTMKMIVSIVQLSEKEKLDTLNLEEQVKIVEELEKHHKEHHEEN